MILDPSHEGSAEHVGDHVQVEVRMRINDDSGASANEVLDAVDRALTGALSAAGYWGAEQIVSTWHEERGNESREAKGI